jgi:hypothetical protein
MSEKKRTLDEIKQEYANICSKAGNINYQISCMKDDLNLLHEQMRELNQEGAKLIAESKSAGESK